MEFSHSLVAILCEAFNTLVCFTYRDYFNQYGDYDGLIKPMLTLVAPFTNMV